MAINIDINSTQVYQARDAVRELEQEYQKLQAQIQSLNQAEAENGRLTIAQQQQYEELSNKISATNIELNQYYDTIDSLDPNNLTAKFDEIYGSVQPLTTQIGELEDRLYQMRLEGEANSEEFTIITERIATMKQAIKETDMEIDILSANKGISGLKDQFGALGTSLMNLDFKNASRSLDGMVKSMKAVDPKAKAQELIQFGKSAGGSLVQGVATATKTVWSFTAALLANPIVLIITAVVALGVAMYKLKDQVEIFAVVFDALGKVVDWVKGLFTSALDIINKFTDWLGITNVEEEKLNEDRKRRAQEYSDLTEQRVKEQNNAFQNELKVLQRRGINTQEDIDREYQLTLNILRNEKQKTQAKIEAVQAEVNLLKTKRKLTDEEKDQLKEQQQALIDLKLTVDNVNNDILLAQIDSDKKSSDLRDKKIKEDEAKQKEADDKAKKAREEYARKREQFEKDRVEALKTIQNIAFQQRINAITDEQEKEYQIRLDALEKERKDLLKNTTLTKDEIAKIDAYYNQLAVKALEDRNKAQQDIRDKDKEEQAKKEEEFGNRLLSQRLKLLADEAKKSREDANKYEQERYQARRKELAKQKAEDLKDLDVNSEEYKAKQAYWFTEEQIAYKEHMEAMGDITADYDAKDEAQFRDKWNKRTEAIKSGFNEANLGFAEGTYNLSEQLTKSLDNIFILMDDADATVEDKALAIAGAALGMINGILDTIAQAQQEQVEASLSRLDEATNAQMSALDTSLNNGLISQEQYEQQKYQLELQAYNQEEAIRKKAFEQDKRMKLAQASIAMAQGMVGAFTSAMTLPAPASYIVGGIMAAAVGVMGAINIAKIKATKYQSGTPPSPPKVPSINVDSAMGDGRTIDGYDTGRDNNYSQQSSTVIQPAPVMSVNATVSVVELDTVQNKVNKYQSNGEL